MKPLERDIERALVGMVKRKGGFCLKWVCPGWAGVPDRIVLLPGGRVMFVETKRPKGEEPRALQKWWHKTIRGLGFQCWVVYSHEDIAKLTKYIEEEMK